MRKIKLQTISTAKQRDRRREKYIDTKSTLQNQPDYHDPERREAYKEVYSEKEIDEAIPSCRELRAKFESGREALLKKYGNFPFTKKLRDIDVTTVVLYLSTC